MALFTDLLLGANLRSWFTVILPTALVGYWGLWIVYARTLHPLAKIPGPFWPSVSRTWLMYHAWIGDLEIQQRALHKQYGPLARVAPPILRDEVTCDDPREIPTVYPITKPLEKTPWFTNRSEKDHSAYRKTLGHIYSLSSILKSESLLDESGSLFLQRLDGFADKNEAFDFGLWLEMFCYDNIGVIFFGKQFGFLKDGVDYGGYIGAVHQAMPFLHVLASAPAYVRPFLMGGAVVIPRLLKAVIAITDVTKTAERETYEAQARTESATAKRVDMTSLMLGVMREKGEKDNFGLREIVSENWTAVMAGADSTSIALRSVFYFLMKNPETLDKARTEVDAAFADGILTTPILHSQAIKLPYLGAVIKESFRLYAPFAAPSQRYSPRPQGLDLAGTHIPGGWRVGLNPAVVQHHREVFGEDAGTFRPERWLNRSAEQTKLMQKCMMHFGAGTRTCTGQHIAMTEINKIVPEILRRYEFKLAHDGEWKTQNAAFNIQTGVTCYFKKRELADKK
ncbi:hypothetical protein N0V83_009849 [Neocucurbitaria cava]|uniref:Cytochrome P450 n=1 Tax=Neocucurbitaria cava TaxID=798079 RepID=A0A9W9CI44_9PLEO|nr:hypothetical protein N0V83_009849 [Neocucurbitaria cava]